MRRIAILLTCMLMIGSLFGCASGKTDSSGSAEEDTAMIKHMPSYIVMENSRISVVVNKQTGIGLGRPMSHVALLELPGYPKLLGVTDGGMIPNPDLEGKKAIAHNAVAMFHGLGYERPLVSAVCAAENVSPKIIETVDAAALKQARGRVRPVLCGRPHLARSGPQPRVRADQGL